MQIENPLNPKGHINSIKSFFFNRIETPSCSLSRRTFALFDPIDRLNVNENIKKELK